MVSVIPKDIGPLPLCYVSFHNALLTKRLFYYMWEDNRVGVEDPAVGGYGSKSSSSSSLSLCLYPDLYRVDVKDPAVGGGEALGVDQGDHGLVLHRRRR